MRNKLMTLGLAVIMVCGSLVNSSCYGTFALTKKVYEWNGSIAGDDLTGKFVKTLVYYGLFIIPVYELFFLGDVIILNLIEFWTGSNPMAMGPNDMEEQLVMKDGKSYKITATQNRFSIAEEVDGEFVKQSDLVFDTEKLSWNYEKDGESTELCTIKPRANGNDVIEYKDRSGNLAWVTLNQLEANYEDYLATK